MRKTKWKVGDRVVLPACDNAAGTVIEVGYNGFTRVRFDDGEIGCVFADELSRSLEMERKP